ncbi:MAG TPA: DNA polymerase [Candidatus Paceibacterota bacterium]|nr:DNA polymerase [Candidatus Paceibacterota bacterium]
MSAKTSTKEKKSKGSTRRRLVLLDMHAILHRAYHALPEFSTSAGEPSGALYGLAAMLVKTATDLKPDYIAAAYDLAKPTHRHEAFDGYKAKRVKADDELVAQIERSRDVLSALSIPAYEQEGFEADDVLGTIVEQTKGDNDLEVVIATGDMDTLQLVDKERVRVFTLRKGINDTVLYAHDDVVARYGFTPDLLPDFKGLRGDPSDNIPGIQGIGEKTATTLITAFGGLPKIYRALAKDREAFAKAGITPRIQTLLEEGKEDAEFSKLLGTIRRDAPIRFALPKNPWKEEADLEKALALFQELEFRSLSPRLKTLLGGGAEAGLPDASSEEEKKEGKEARPPASEEELRELKVMRWLLSPDMTNPTEEDVFAYAKTDDPKAAHAALAEEIREKDLTRVFEEIERPLIPVIAEMIKNGVKLDVSYLRELSKTYHKELESLEKRIYETAGKEFNVNSPRQLGDVLFDTLGLKGGRKTGTGQRSTRESELTKLKDEHPIINEIFRYRELQKLLSTYIDAFPSMLGEDGRLHATFIQTGAATGRMSSQSPNLQNIPIRTELGRAVRGAFVAERGFVLVTFDYSQIELRIAAIMSKDEKLLQTFRDDGDIHTAVASQMFHVSEGDVTPTMRRTAKVINFGVIYGMGANALSATAGISRSDAQKYLADYEAAFAGLTRFMETVKGDARREGFTTTMFGRKRFLPGIRSPLPHIQAEAERQAVNAPLQGTSADIIKLAMVSAHEEFAKGRSEGRVRLVLQIHDELVFEIHDEDVARVVPKIKDIMESVLSPEETSGVPITVAVEVGKRWSEMRPFAHGESANERK